MNVKNHKEPTETFALLKILALSNREIKQGKFRDAWAKYSNSNRP